jgi:hypothetical protein
VAILTLLGIAIDNGQMQVPRSLLPDVFWEDEGSRGTSEALDQTGTLWRKKTKESASEDPATVRPVIYNPHNSKNS